MKRAAMKRVLLVQGGYGDSVGPALEQNGYAVSWVHSARSALELLDHERPSVVVVDMPSLKGSAEKLCASIKKSHQLPIIVLEGEVVGDPEPMEHADIVLTRPLQMRKLLSRVEKLMPEAVGPEYKCGEITFFPASSKIRYKGEDHYLNPKLCKLLNIFMTRPGQLILRKTLMQEVWETNFMGDTRTLDVHVRWLREYVEDDPNEPIYLRTVRGQGYRFEFPKQRR